MPELWLTLHMHVFMNCVFMLVQENGCKCKISPSSGWKFWVQAEKWNKVQTEIHKDLHTASLHTWSCLQTQPNTHRTKSVVKIRRSKKKKPPKKKKKKDLLTNLTISACKAMSCSCIAVVKRFHRRPTVWGDISSGIPSWDRSEEVSDWKTTNSAC